MPKGYPAEGQPYPLILQLDGHAFEQLITPEMLDEMIEQEKFPPCVVVFLPPNGDRMLQYACNDNFNEFLAIELIPELRDRFHCSTEAKDTFITGSSMGGLASFYAGLTHPEVFGHVVSQSGALQLGREKIDQEIDKFIEKEGETHFVMDAGEFELGLFGNEVSLSAANDERNEKMQDNEYMAPLYEYFVHDKNFVKM